MYVPSSLLWTAGLWTSNCQWYLMYMLRMDLLHGVAQHMVNCNIALKLSKLAPSSHYMLDQLKLAQYLVCVCVCT